MQRVAGSRGSVAARPRIAGEARALPFTGLGDVACGSLAGALRAGPCLETLDLAGNLLHISGRSDSVEMTVAKLQLDDMHKGTANPVVVYGP